MANIKFYSNTGTGSVTVWNRDYNLPDAGYQLIGTFNNGDSFTVYTTTESQRLKIQFNPPAGMGFSSATLVGNNINWNISNNPNEDCIVTSGTTTATLTATFNNIYYTITQLIPQLDGTSSQSTDYGSSTNSPASQVYGGTVNISATANAGYRFSRWETTAAAISSSTSANTTITMPAGNVVCRPFFVVNSHTLTANANGGSITSTSGWSGTGNTATKSVQEGSQYGTLPSLANRTGYNSLGWFTQSSGGSQVTSSTVMGTSDASIWVHWSAKTYTLTLYNNDGSGNFEQMLVTYDKYSQEAMPPERIGYTFLGYYDQISGGTQYFDDGGRATRAWDKDENNPAVYAHWEANTYTITFDDQGGTGGPEEIQVLYDGPLPELSQSELPTKTGYVFFSYRDSDETTYYDSQGEAQLTAYTYPDDLTLYANYDARSYEVTLDENGGEGGTTSVVATYDSPMPSGLLPPSKEGFDFKGYWYNGVQYYSSSMQSTHNWDIDQDNISLIAKWETPTPVQTNFVKVFDQSQQDWIEATVKVYKNEEWVPIYAKKWDGNNWVQE